MAANPADLDPEPFPGPFPDPDPDLDPGPDPDPASVAPARPNRGGVRTALTSRSAGWVVATLLAGALTGLAVNVATAPPSATVVRQVSVVGPGGLGRFVSLPPALVGPGVLSPCRALAPSPRFIYLPTKRGLVVRGSGKITAVPAPKKVVGRLKTNFIQVPGGVVGPACGFGVVAPGAQCNVIGMAPGQFSIHAIGPRRQVFVHLPTPVTVHAQVAKLPPGVQVPALGPGARIYCPG